jgi:hypothetical protein
LAVGAVALHGCGHPNPGGPDSSIDAAPKLDGPWFPEASCFVRIDSPALQPGNHVPIYNDEGGLNQITTWDSNPPSSGDHYPIWAAFQEYDAAVPRGYYVHDLEHGAIDFLYKCSDDGGAPDAGDAGGDAGDGGDAGLTGCAALVDGLRQAVASIPTDPLCDVDSGLRVRFVITPDPLIDHPVAAAAWGWTYNADCVDLATLEAFAKAHYAQGTENFCANGTTQF